MLATLLLTTSIITAAPTPSVLIVGPGHYATIDDAIAAASPGDTIRVRPGSYPGFTLDGIGLSIVSDRLRVSPAYTLPVGDSSQPRLVNIASAIVRNIPAGSTAFLSGLNIHATTEVLASAGSVRLANCTLRVGFQFPGLPSAGLQVTDSTDVAAYSCLVSGPEYPGYGINTPAWSGGHGLVASNSRVSCYGCVVRGAPGYHVYYYTGGHWSELWGPGGHGIVVHAGSEVFVMGGEARGGWGFPYGAAITSSGACLYQGAYVPGDIYGNVIQLPGPARTLVGPTAAPDGDTVHWVVAGAQGEGVMLYFGTSGETRPLYRMGGVLLVSPPYAFQFVGSLPGSTGQFDANLPGLGGGALPYPLHVQAVHLLPAGGRVLGGAWILEAY